ncbi:uncharacterized protein J3D65DRAFT_355206 [Phyllosticta citribraziliensis]|uniref:Uncharacterized protein n=1 Tax=Phyllosticta citribraziliensis TaxID=989973 RepID=A0ABR1LNS6_9PEZI
MDDAASQAQSHKSQQQTLHSIFLLVDITSTLTYLLLVHSHHHSIHRNVFNAIFAWRKALVRPPQGTASGQNVPPRSNNADTAHRKSNEANDCGRTKSTHGIPASSGNRKKHPSRNLPSDCRHGVAALFLSGSTLSFGRRTKTPRCAFIAAATTELAGSFSFGRVGVCDLGASAGQMCRALGGVLRLFIFLASKIHQLIAPFRLGLDT